MTNTPMHERCPVQFLGKVVCKPAGFVGFNTVTNTRSGRLAGNWKGSEVGIDVCRGPCLLSVTSGVTARHHRVAVKPPPSFPPETARNQSFNKKRD